MESGCVGDQPLHVITKTRRREIMYGNSPQAAKMEQFEEFAVRCNVSKCELARTILAMTWEERMGFLCKQFSADKQVLKVLTMAKDKVTDQEPEPKRSKLFTSISRREEEANSEDIAQRLVETSSSNDMKIDNQRKPVPVKPAPEGLFYRKRLDLFSQESSNLRSMFSWDIESDEEEESSVSRSGIHLLVFLIDASVKMKNSLVGEESTSAFQTSLGCAHATLMNKVLNSPKDRIAVISYGNPPDPTKDSVYHSVRQIIPLSMPSSENILMLEDLMDGESGLKDFDEKFGFGELTDVKLHEALWKCQEVFGSYKGKVGMKTVVLLTNHDKPHEYDSKLDQLTLRKAKDLHGSQVKIDVVPVCQANDNFNMEHFFGGLVKLDDDTAPITQTDINNLDNLVIRRTNIKRSNGKYLFDIGGGNVIGVSSYNMVRKKYRPSKKKLASDTNEPVRMKRVYTHPVTKEKLLPSSTLKFVNYGGKNIKFTMDEKKSMNNLEVDAHPLKLCGFKPLSLIKPSDYVRCCSFLYPSELTVEGSKSMFSALLHSCHKKQVMAVCKFKPRSVSGMSFVGLIPQLEEKDENGVQIAPPGFHVFYLPWLDDMRPVPLVNLSEEVSTEAVDAAEEVIKKLKLKRWLPVDNCSIESVNKLVEAHALHRDDYEKPEDETLPDIERMKRKLGDKAQSFLGQVYDSDYDPLKGAKKAKQEKTVKEKPKKVDVCDIDMEAEYKKGSVAKLTVDTLKSWCKSQGIAVTGKKKADLVDIVSREFS